MTDDPSPPPEEQDDGEPELYPFMDAAATGGAEIAVRAGWADAETGEVSGAPVVNYEGSAGSPAAERAFEAAIEWYRDVLSALMSERGEG